MVQQTNGQRRWGLPGAHIDPVDLPTAAVVREVRRETGLETRVVDLVGLYHLTGGLDGDDEVLPDLITYCFRCEVVSGEAVLNGQGRICHLGWHPTHDVPKPATTTATAAVADAAAGRSGVVRHLAR
jgi:ADP-ribose pyrophosphatase YjhB (NUDIX family)